MGFKVMVRKNGATHGEAHYTSEAVAVGMAKKMRNAGADVTLARCNGSACGCGSKSNPRFTSPGYVVIRRSGQQDEFRTLAEAKAAVSRASGGRKTLKWKAVGRDENGEPNDWLCDDVDDEIRKVGAKSNPRRRNGTTAALEQKIAVLEAALPKSAVREALAECGWSGPMMMASRSEMESYLRELRRRVKSNPRRRNGTTAGEMAASRSMAYTNLFR